MHVFQVRKQSVSLCWDIRRHDVPLVDTTCTDQDGDEERDVVHHELHQPQSDASWTSEDETQNVRSVVLAKCQVYPSLSVFHLSEKRICLNSHPSCLCHETLQVFDQWMAELSRSKLSAAAATASDFLALASLAASAASPNCVLKASTRCENVQRLPMLFTLSACRATRG